MSNTLSAQTQNHTSVRRTFWTVAIFYLLIAFEFFYMASPFAVYFYSVYRPGLNFLSSSPTLSWLSSIFLPHIVIETSSPIINTHNWVGGMLFLGGFLAFCIGAGQIYYYKLTRKGTVTGGIYNIIRHPQYVALAICSFGLLLMWPRYLVLLSFVTMLFAYYFLAAVEEKECETKFGQSYLDYKSKTNMFLPFRLPLSASLPDLPTAGLKRYAAILTIYALSLLLSVGLANGLRNWSVSSLYASYTKDAAYISVAQLDEQTLERIIQIAQSNPEVQTLQEGGGKFMNYVLPSSWHVSEIPMNPVDGNDGHHFPKNIDETSYKIVFTQAKVGANQDAQGKNIIINTRTRTPLGEAWVDLIQQRVIEVKEPPAKTKYEGVPVPVY